jgi:hypothetical protein
MSAEFVASSCARSAATPLTQHNFRLRPVPDVIELLQGAGLLVEDQRQLGKGDHAFHLLVAKSR